MPMGKALEELKRYRRTAAWVLGGNERAIRFYERCGFRFDGKKQELTWRTTVTEAGMTVNTEKPPVKTLFAPGRALRAYKPDLVQRMMDFLMEAGLVEGEYTACCKEPQCTAEKTVLINCCPGCSRKFETALTDVIPVSLWKTLLDTDFPFPDYHGRKMAIHDACHARNRNSSEMQAAARALCRRMNIELTEPAHTLDEARCCGGSAPDFETRKDMALRRAAEFSAEDVAVYCTGCVRSFSLTPVHPRHLLDLLFEEPTEGLTVQP